MGKFQVFNNYYKGILIKSDIRVHFEVLKILSDSLKRPISNIALLDIACGEGALAQRIIDSFEGITVDCNDLDKNVKTLGARRIYSKNLNNEFNFESKYDVIIAAEIIEHLENPWHFIRNLKKNLKPKGFIILTTPSIDSFFDRLWFLFYGYHFYFGKRGITNSDGHFTICSCWLISYISQSEKLSCVRIKNSINHDKIMSFKGRFLLCLLQPIKLILKNTHDESSLICVLKNK